MMGSGGFRFIPLDEDVEDIETDEGNRFEFREIKPSVQEQIVDTESRITNKITEEELDNIESNNRPSVFEGTKEAFKSAGKEISYAKDFISDTANYLAPAIKEQVLYAASPLAAFSDEDRFKSTFKVANDIKRVLPEVVKSSPEIAESIVKDFGESFGIEKSDQTGSLRVDPDVAYAKFREAPISTIGDWVVLGSVFKKAAQIGKKSVNKVSDLYSLDRKEILNSTDSDKKFVKDMLGKMDDGDKEATFSKEIAEVTRSETPTIKDRLVDRRKALLSMSNKDLDSPEFVQKLGNRVKENVKNLESVERKRLDSSLSKVASNKVDSEGLFQSISNDLKDDFLLSKVHDSKGGPFKERIRKGFKGTMVENLLDEVDDTTSVKELNKIRQRLDQSINFKDPKSSDRALMIARKNIDSYIKGLEGAEDYARESEKVSDRLQLFFDKQKKIKKSGGGEKFAKQFFDSHEEVDELLNVLKNSDTSVAQYLRADIEMLDAWHTWNRMWANNENFVPQFYAGTPLTLGMRAGNAITPPIAKGIVKSQVFAAPALQNLPSLGQTAKSAAVSGTALDTLRRDINN